MMAPTNPATWLGMRLKYRVSAGQAEYGGNERRGTTDKIVSAAPARWPTILFFFLFRVAAALLKTPGSAASPRRPSPYDGASFSGLAGIFVSSIHRQTAL